jgi:hypothetical protein
MHRPMNHAGVAAHLHATTVITAPVTTTVTTVVKLSPDMAGGSRLYDGIQRWSVVLRYPAVLGCNTASGGPRLSYGIRRCSVVLRHPAVLGCPTASGDARFYYGIQRCRTKPNPILCPLPSWMHSAGARGRRKGQNRLILEVGRSLVK